MCMFVIRFGCAVFCSSLYCTASGVDAVGTRRNGLDIPTTLVHSYQNCSYMQELLLRHSEHKSQLLGPHRDSTATFM